jgi:Fe-S-cluster containining protein
LSRSKKLRKALQKRQAQEAAVRRDEQGRAHLQLIRDPETGRSQLKLTAAFFRENWQNEIATVAANAALNTLRDEPDVPHAIELTRSAMHLASEMSEQFLAVMPAGTVACKGGCAHCCHQPVGITAIEAIAIVDRLRQTLSEAELTQVRARVAEAHQKARGSSTAERFSTEQPCPFLKDAQCTIYDVRPLVCRGMNSRDAEACARILRDPVARDEFLANPATGHSFAVPVRASLSISVGLQLALSDLYGLDMRPLDLIAAVQLLLSEGSSIHDAWLSGDAPFESARAPEGGIDARTRVLMGGAGGG